MPNLETFSVDVIREFVLRYLRPKAVAIDPFARNCDFAHPYTNDLNPDTAPMHHMEAIAFLKMLEHDRVSPDITLFDPPYSPRQIQECYNGIGRVVTQRDTQKSAAWAEERDVISRILKPGGVVLSFGWNSNGMGKGRGFEIEEILLVAHGASHNDTICLAERKIENTQKEF